MRVVAVVAAGLAVLAAGCGSHGSRRAAVDRYFGRVDTAQAQLSRGLRLAAAAYAGFARDTPAERAQLRRAQATLAATRSRISRIPCPPDARPIRADLLRLADRELAAGNEIAGLARFLPSARAELRRVSASGASLSGGLARGRTVPGQQAALQRYARALAASAFRLARMPTPVVLRPWRDGQVARLRQLAAAARDLAATLPGHHTAALRAGVARLQLAAAVPAAAVRAEQLAVRAYNGRVRSLSRLAARIQAERDALERRLG